jgi:YaaC-like Protein
MAVLRPWTPIVTGTRLAPPYPGPTVMEILEAPSPELIWREIEMEASYPDRGRALFTGSFAQRNKLWREFRSYVRQAREYDDAARNVKGPSAALLLYYAALNLAKAELLTSVPNLVSGQKISHGLSYSPTGAKTISGDFLKVQAGGVFPLLYRKRTGKPLANNVRIRVKPLLGYMQEIAWEVIQTSFTPLRYTGLLHFIAIAGAQGWAMMALSNPNSITGHRVTNARFKKLFEPVSVPVGLDWRNAFAVSQRMGGETRAIFEGRRKYTFHPAPGGGYPSADFIQVSNGTWTDLIGLIDDGTDDEDDAVLGSSLSGAQFLPMPPSLARYALMYYVSSLVRYKPDQLDPRLQPEQHWLLAAFVDQARTRLLRSALTGIRNKRHLFHSPGVYRT